LKVDKNKVRKSARKNDGDITDPKRLGRPTKFTLNTKHLAMNQVTGRRSVAMKLNFSEDFQARNKKAGVTTVRRYVKSTDWGKVTTSHTARKTMKIFSRPIS